MNRLFRRVLRHCGIDVPFRDVVCPQHVKSIRVHDKGRTEVIEHRSLVFLSLPEPGELRDFVPDAAAGENPYLSPDAFEIQRTPTRRGIQIEWVPNEPIVRYGMYTHQHGWTVPDSLADAVCAEFHCDMRTGVVDVEIIIAARFEAGVAFKRPRWRRLNTETSLIKYALKQLDAEGERAAIAEDGSRLQWKLVGPGIGQRYLYVAFQENGVEQWRQRLEANTLTARMRRLIARPVAST